MMAELIRKSVESKQSQFDLVDQEASDNLAFPKLSSKLKRMMRGYFKLVFSEQYANFNKFSQSFKSIKKQAFFQKLEAS